MEKSGVKKYREELVIDDWPVDGSQVRWGVPAAALCLLGAQIFAMVWFVFIAGSIYGSDPLPPADNRPIWTLLAFNAGLWIAYFAGPLVAKRFTASGPMVDFDVRTTPLQALVAVIVGIGCQLALLPALYWVLALFWSADPGRSAQDLADRVDGAGDVILLSVAVILVAPIVEEWFYRGMLLSTLARRFGLVAGAVGSSAVFALVHQEAILLPGLFVLALILAWMTMRTAKIGPAIVAHMAFNATTVVQLLIL